MVLQKNAVLAPFLGDRLSFIRGLDPLGLQNTSEATFAYLLPGLNNVTGRIRYYSFYCWLLDTYAADSGSTDPEVQKRFIRRAELITALLARFAGKDIGAIPGTLHAGRMVQERPEGPFDLEEHTFNKNGGTENTYWKYPTGAFGQYYLGALRDIGLVLERSEGASIYVRTNRKVEEGISGEDLAQAFSTGVPTAAQRRFLQVLQSGRMTMADIEALLPHFRMDLVPGHSAEQELLMRLLAHRDYPAQQSETPRTQRSQTIKHLLQFAAAHAAGVSSRAFTIFAYQHLGMSEEREDECLTGWYYYQLNEYWQFGCLAAFNGALHYLENLVGPDWISVTVYLDQLVRGMEAILFKQYVTRASELPLGHLLNLLNEDEETWVAHIGKTEGLEQAISGFLLAMKVCWANQAQLARLKNFANRRDIARNGDVVTWAMRLPGHVNQPLRTFMRDFFWKHILQRHQLVALRKMTAGQSSQKFIIEDQKIRLLETFRPTFTGPRISNLIGFLHDLHVLDDENRPTELAIQMQQYLNPNQDDNTSA